MTQPFNLNGKTALITGGAGLLGMEHAEALLACGATVVLADLSPERVQAATQRPAQQLDANSIITSAFDVSKEDEVLQATAQLSETAGRGFRSNSPTTCR